ncbi:MAG: DMT family transporter [Amylibacter sp.]|jgi:drug/metabolite transporter (DMT)-like permease
MKSKSWLFVPLITIGATWGLTIPAIKIAVSGGYPVLGVLFWQVFLAAFTAFILFLPRRRTFKLTKRRLILFAWIMAFGSILPGIITYTSAFHLPAGVMAITIAMVPIFIMPIAIATGHETFKKSRALGVLMGAISIVLLIGPEASLPDPAKAGFVLLAIISPFCYALEDNFVAYFGLDGMTPVETLLGSAVMGSVVLGVVVSVQGSFIPLWENGFEKADYAILVIGFTTGLAYAGFIWLIGQGGPVFAGLVAYLVTFFGVIWSILILNETYSSYIWAAFAIMCIGMFLVRPKVKSIKIK